MRKEVEAVNLARRENAVARLACINPSSLPLLLPTARWTGAEIEGTTPIDTSIRHFSDLVDTKGLHIVELFGGIGLGVLRTALAGGYKVHTYTYVDRDPISRSIARVVLNGLQALYPLQLPATATKAFDRGLPQDIAHISNNFLQQLLVDHGPVDLLGASWECQNVSRAGHQRGAADPRFLFFYDMVRIINYLQHKQASPMVYILENTFPGELCTAEVNRAGKLVQSFIGAPLLIDAADLGAAAHRVRLFWTNMLPPAVLQAALPKILPPYPSLSTILHPYHLPTMPGHNDHFPFARQNRV